MSRAAAVDLRWCDRPHGSASFLFFDPTGLSHQTCYRRFHELAMDQTAIDEELRGLSRPKASKSRIDIEERGAAAQYLRHGLRSRRSWAGMSPGPSRAAASLERSAVGAAGRLDLDEARGRWLGGKRTCRGGLSSLPLRG